MNHKRIFFSSLVSLATILACVLPGLQTASAPIFAPTVDTSRVETTVAETVSAAIAQTEQSRPTLTTHATFTAVPIASPAPATTTPQIILSGSTLTVQVDASTVFVDELAGFEITVPAAWLITRVDGEEYLDAFQLAEAADEDIQKSLLRIQDEDPRSLRLYALDAQDGHIQNGFVTHMEFVWNEKNLISLESDEALKIGATQFAETIPGMEILSAKVLMVNEIPMGMIELTSTVKNSSGVDVVILQKQAIFHSSAGQMTITLSTVEGLQEILFPVFDAMLETVKINTK